MLYQIGHLRHLTRYHIVNLPIINRISNNIRLHTHRITNCQIYRNAKSIPSCLLKIQHTMTGVKQHITQTYQHGYPS